MNGAKNLEPDCPEEFFKRDFPSLKGQDVVIPVFNGDGKKWGFQKHIVQKYCLDKQRVKKAIDKVIPLDENCATNMIINNELKKELGLE